MTTEREVALEAEEIVVQLGRKTILDGVSMELRQGELLALVGPNGAGKSTFLKSLLRILALSGGAVRIFGRPLESFKQHELAQVVGYVPQASDRFPPFSVREYALLGRYPYLSPFTPLGKKDFEIVDEALETTGLRDLADRMIGTLSGGERQRVLIAAALTQNARVLLLDEPTTFLDPKHQAEILDLLVRLTEEQGISILAVTHDINTAASRAHRVAALRQGRVVFCGDPKELMQRETLSAVFDHEFTFLTHPESGKRVVLP